MRILFIHNRYQIRGGEDKVFEQECELLKSYGHDVEILLISNDDIKSVLAKALAGMRVKSSNWGRRIVENAILDFQPDIVHVHNFFPLLSPSIFSVFNEHNIPCVMTLHNYRIICPTATLVIDGKVNEQSIKKSSYRLVRKKFYKDSYIGSLLVARMVEFHKKKGTWRSNVDRFIALTEFAKSKFVESGVPQNKIIVKPNFIHNTDEGDLVSSARFGALFVGRISPEKGLTTLLSAWKHIDYPLVVAGGGATDEMLSSASANVTFLGNVDSEKISELMRKASFLVMPSEWYEGFPMVLVESYFNRLPVVASDIGSLSELVIDNTTGLKFTPGDRKALILSVNQMINDPKAALEMGDNAWVRANKLYSAAENYKKMMSIYQSITS